MAPDPELLDYQRPPSPTDDANAGNKQQQHDHHHDAPLSTAERATLEALSATLRGCNAHLGGSAIGKGFRLAARYHLHKRAPHSLPLIGNLKAVSYTKWDDSALEPGVQHTIEDPFYIVDLGIVSAQLARWRAAFPRVVPFYAIKCNPDPAIVRTLMSLGCNFDCASRAEIELVQQISCSLPDEIPTPEIIYANPCKARGHVIDAVCRGVRMMTFDNVAEVQKCAMVSKKIQLIMRIITDDSGSQCRLSSKFGAPKQHWPILLAEARRCGLDVVGVSFHVGSGCRDATRYEMALKDCKTLFEMAKRDYGYNMTILDIGGGFPGETHSLWNPAKAFGDPTAAEREASSIKPTVLEDIPSIIEEVDGANDEEEDIDEDDSLEGKEPDEESSEEGKERQYMYFNEIAEAVAPMLDKLFPPSSGVKIIAEPGRYLVAASATLVASITSVRHNRTSDKVPLQAISDNTASDNVFSVTRAEEDEIVQGHARVLEQEENPIIETLVEELADYSQRFARANLSQQEVDVYLDNIDANDTEEGMAKAPDMEPGELCTEDGTKLTHTVEGMQAGIVVGCADMFDDDASAISGMRSRDGSSKLLDIGLDIPCILAAAGEAAVSGIVRQAIADSAQPLQDDFAYYINDGVYGAFNNLLFDHAIVRPRKLRNAICPNHKIIVDVVQGEGEDDAFRTIKVVEEEKARPEDESLYPSTVFGPTCDSMDVLTRGVLLPKMDVGDWMYFQNMGAYTSAAASTFNGFPTTEKFYVCSVPPHHFMKLVAEGRVSTDVIHTIEEENKEG
jgi:diaminopimelate decarboxylase